MRVHVGNIPRLANEEALANWFARAGFHVESVHLVREDESRGSAWVEIADEGLPPKALQHLNGCSFWGRPLVVQKVKRETEGGSGHAAGPWASPEAA